MTRYERAKIAAQKKVDDEQKALTSSTPSESLGKSNMLYEPEIASSTARTAHTVAEPRIPAGKATSQAISSRQQILEDRQTGGISVLAEESREEIIAQQKLAKQRPSRKRTTSIGLKGFADRVSESLQGKATGVLGVDNGRR